MSADLLPPEGPFHTPPLSRDPECGVCGCPAHLLRCDSHGCDCDKPPVPGVQT